MTVCRRFPVFDDLDGFEESRLVMLQHTPHYWDWSEVFLMISLALEVLGEEDHRDKSHFHHIISMVHTVNVIYDY